MVDKNFISDPEAEILAQIYAYILSDAWGNDAADPLLWEAGPAADKGIAIGGDDRELNDYYPEFSKCETAGDSDRSSPAVSGGTARSNTLNPF